MSRRRRPSWLFAIVELAAMSWAFTEYCPISTLPVFEGSEPVFTFPFLTHYFKVAYKCKLGFKLISEHAFTMLCVKDSWIPNKDFCERIHCGQPPNITDGFHNGNATTYPFGTKIHYRCSKNLSLIGASFMVCSANENLTGLWKEKPPKCRGVFCKDPVVEHGIMITEPEKLYMYGSKVKFRCKIGYFMIGNYSIRCEKNSIWVPKEPSCKKISPGICGLPSILDGNIQPLQSQYETGKTAVITCNQNYSFIDNTITMTTQCQGYNLWNPPVQLCFFKTSPDNFHLFIKHGKIVYGKKQYYNPGDEVDIVCHAGYVLIGPSKITYIGGKKWLPSVPNCHLRLGLVKPELGLLSFSSTFLILAIARYLPQTSYIWLYITCVDSGSQNVTPEIYRRKVNKRKSEKNEKEGSADTATIIVAWLPGA